MSKWIKKDLFEKFKEKKRNEKDETGIAFNRKEIVWKTPEKGTEQENNIYSGRLLPDNEGNFTKKYFYHFFQTGDSWNYFLCPKTDDNNKYCPICDVNSKLWKGSEEDKNIARKMKRNQRYVVNFYIKDDFRDAKTKDENDKVIGKVKLYEYPQTIESKIKNEITDDKEGLGPAIFDPENGYDLLVHVKSKPRDQYGKVWPDYSDTKFSRKSTSIADSEEKIQKIMDSTYNLNEYIDSMRKPIEDMIKVLKAENLYELIDDKEIKEDDFEKELDETFNEDDNEIKEEQNDDIEDDDIINELEDLMND